MGNGIIEPMVNSLNFMPLVVLISKMCTRYPYHYIILFYIISYHIFIGVVYCIILYYIILYYIILLLAWSTPSTSYRWASSYPRCAHGSRFSCYNHFFIVIVVVIVIVHIVMRKTSAEVYAERWTAHGKRDMVQHTS